MDAVMDRLFAEWHRFGAPVLLAEAPGAIAERTPEALIGESTAYCRYSGRLTWIVLAWLIDHAGELDGPELVAATKSAGDLSVLGLLCDAARQRRPHPTFDQAVAAGRPNARLEPFFHRVAKSALATRIAQEHPEAVFLRWNYLSSELQYLDETSRKAG